MIMGSIKRGPRAECIHISNAEGRKLDCSTSELKVDLKPALTLSLSFSLESLLQKVTNHENSVVLAVVGNNYRDMLMSWVCRLRRLKIYNFLVCAIDHQAYQFAVLQVCCSVQNKGMKEIVYWLGSISGYFHVGMIYKT
jgi:hypothetical protein